MNVQYVYMSKSFLKIFDKDLAFFIIWRDWKDRVKEAEIEGNSFFQCRYQYRYMAAAIILGACKPSHKTCSYADNKTAYSFANVDCIPLADYH